MNFIKRYGKYLLISAVLLAAEFGSMAIMTAAKTNTVVIISESKQPGYEKQPGYARVEASWSKIWHDTWHSNAKFLVILGLIFAFVPAVVGFFGDASNAKGGIAWSLWGSAAISLFLLFIACAAKYGSSSYEKRMCLDEYEASKGNIDALFPSTDTESFLKGCK